MTYRPHPVRSSGERPGSRFRQAGAVIGVLVVALLAATSATAEPSVVASKQARAQEILGQVQAIDAQLEHAVEAYNLANIKLDGIRHDIEVNRRHLKIARVGYAHAQRRLADRLVAIYTGGGGGSALSVLLGATSLNDLLRRIDTVNRVSDQDSRVLGQMTRFKSEMQSEAVKLRNARAEQERVVAARAAQRASIEHQLAERRALLSSVRAEITRLQAQERTRQLAMARAARSRTIPAPDPSSLGIGAVGSDGTSVAPPARYGGVVGIAMRYLGTPYRWGGASPGGFDCSGFTMYVYAQVGVSLPHNAAAQYGYGSPVSRDQLQAGDLVFFNGLGHVGIYIGGGQFIHSPHTGDVVKISSISGWYASTWVGARRL